MDRAAWQVAHGPPPLGLWVLHRCDNKRCVRLSHLFLGDHNRNMADMTSKGRQCAGERNACSKLGAAAVREIRDNPKGLTGVELARRFRISKSVVCNIQKGKAWRHLLP